MSRYRDIEASSKTNKVSTLLFIHLPDVRLNVCISLPTYAAPPLLPPRFIAVIVVVVVVVISGARSEANTTFARHCVTGYCMHALQREMRVYSCAPPPLEPHVRVYVYVSCAFMCGGRQFTSLARRW